MSKSDADEQQERGRHAAPRSRNRALGVFTRLLVAILVLALAWADYVRWTSPSASGAGTGAITGFYLDIGASASLGFQPTGIEHHNGARTLTGYSNNVVTMLARKGVDLTLREVGCPGETTYSMLNTGDHCYKTHPGGSQRKAAKAFLAQHYNDVGLVTIDLGFNDVRACMWRQPPDLNCTAAGLKQVQDNMPGVLALLKKAAGPHVHFVGVLYADPFLDDVVNPNSTLAYAEQTRQVVLQLDKELTTIYHAAGMAVANVPGVFHLSDTSPTTWNGQQVPTNVRFACSWTWMCTDPPYGRDDHPNNAGYRAIANAIVAATPPTW